MNYSINEIIARVLSGDASSEEKQWLLSWFEESEGNAKEFGNYEMLWNALEIIGRKNEFDTKRAYQKFTDYVEGIHENTKQVSFIVKFLRIAAIVLLTSGIAYFAGYYSKPKVDAQEQQCQIVTPKGAKTFVELSDGTKVWLNSESKLKYPGKFSNDIRNVYLEGEGYFEVAKDKQRPFIVHTSKVNVRAVGTAFNVKSYPSEDIIQTTLVEGSVIIEKQLSGQTTSSNKKENASIAFLKPNQQATFYKSTSVIDISSRTSVLKVMEPSISAHNTLVVRKDSVLLAKEIDTGLFTAWKEDKLVFDNEPFESLSIKLERRFNMKFHFMDEEIKSFRFTGRFNEISMEQLLRALQYASPVHYVVSKNNVYLSIKPIQLKDN